MQLIEELQQKLKKESISVLKLSKETGIEAYRIYKWIAGKGNPKHEDTQKLEKWLRKGLDIVPHGTIQKPLSSVEDEAVPYGKVDYKDKYIRLLEKQADGITLNAILKNHEVLLSRLEQNRGLMLLILSALSGMNQEDVLKAVESKEGLELWGAEYKRKHIAKSGK